MSYEKRLAAIKEMNLFLSEVGFKYFDPLGDTEHLPCFLHRINIPGKIKTMGAIRKFIRLALDTRVGYVEAICISITERDENHLKVLKVAQDDGHTVIGPFRSIHGEYNCWAFFPVRKHTADTEVGIR